MKPGTREKSGKSGEKDAAGNRAASARADQLNRNQNVNLSHS